MIARSVRVLAPLAALLLAAGSVAAQGRPQSPTCRGLRYSGNFRLNSAKLYLDVAFQTQRTDPARSQASLRDAARQLDDAWRVNGSDEMTLAFFSGEVALMRGDLVGADTMFTKADARAEDECKQEILRMRRNEWAPLANGALNVTRTGNLDSALALLRRGNLIYRGEPTGFLRMASIFAQRSQTDSAIAYAQLAARSTEDPRFLDLRRAALFTAARLQQGANRPADAEATYREYLRLTPRDLPAMAALGAVLTQQNKTAEVNVLYDSLSVAADTATDPDVLFDAATELVRARRYPLAARLFERELTFNRCHRDALYNLASTYNVMRDSVRMLPAARRLVAVDSMNRGSLAMLAQAYVMTGDRNKTVETLLRHDSLPWTFELVRFTPADSSASLLGAVSNAQQGTLAPFRLTIEFLNGACEPVSQTVVEVPEVAGNGQSTVDVTGRGTGIRAYRYKTN